MANIEIINVSSPNDGNGDNLRNSQIRANNNFAELNDKKVEKENGKGLTANDFTDELKTKLEEIEEGAGVQVQSDWLQEDDAQPDYIKNKPTSDYLNAFGFLDYADLTTQTTPLNVVAGTELKLTNDKLGANTKIDEAPFGVSSLFNSTTNQFDFSQLNIGDWVDFRNDLNIDLVGTNTSFKMYMKMAIGSGSDWQLNIHNGERKSTDTLQEVNYLGFYIGSQNEIDFPAELYILTDANATVKVNGFLFKIIRKGINIVDIQADLPTVLNNGNVSETGFVIGEINQNSVTVTKDSVRLENDNTQLCEITRQNIKVSNENTNSIITPSSVTIQDESENQFVASTGYFGLNGYLSYVRLQTDGLYLRYNEVIDSRLILKGNPSQPAGTLTLQTPNKTAGTYTIATTDDLRPYKVWSAKVLSNPGDAPATLQILENTLGENLSISSDGLRIELFATNSPFANSNKTVITDKSIQWSIEGSNLIYIENALDGDLIEIRVYN